MTAPAFNDVMRSTGDTWETIPDAPLPYHIAGSDGLFLHRRLLFGRGVVKEKYFPENWKTVGGSRFNFEADPIPAALIGQIVHFFQRVYEKQQTEAAILLTMNTQTKEWGVFVPTQMVSHGGVNYVFDPSHVKQPNIVVGSIHSHADFSPFHSGTDTNDAADFDGFHCTVGYVNTKPQIVAMVAMNGEFMHYKEQDFPLLFDWSGVGHHEAPLWWDRYVGMERDATRPVGYDLYKKFAKAVTVKSERKFTQVTGSEDWKRTSKSSQTQHDWSKPYWLDTNWNSYLLNESKDFNARLQAERGVTWKGDGSLSKKPKASMFWEDDLPSAFIEAIAEADMLSDAMVDFCIDTPEIAGDITFWQEWVVKQAAAIVEAAKAINVTIEMSVQSKDADQQSIWLLPAPKKTKKTRKANYGIR